MRFASFNGQGMNWVENCLDCRKPMQKVTREADEVLIGDPSSYKYRPYPKAFAAFEAEPIVTSNDLWFCEECKSVWAPAAGHWVKLVNRNVEEAFAIQPPALALPFDPGPQPFAESTKCPQCHTWREQRGDWQVCTQCGTGEQVLVHRKPDFPSIVLDPSSVGATR